ncbi:hypothetical protein TrRE_jg1580, partial [Triparma retinervis]
MSRRISTLLVSNLYLSVTSKTLLSSVLDAASARTPDSKTRLVGAFTDKVYGRSSLHFTSTDTECLRGTLNSVIAVAEGGKGGGYEAEGGGDTAHPAFGGAVDNLSVCQLEPEGGTEHAREVARGVEVDGEKVYYGWGGGG